MKAKQMLNVALLIFAVGGTGLLWQRSKVQADVRIGKCAPLAAVVGNAKTPACVALSPDPANLTTAGAQQQFTATGGVVTNWSVAGQGTITQTGLYTAPAVSTNDTVTGCVGTVCATAAVNVTIPVTVNITPPSASVIEGRTQQFSATTTGTNTPVTWAVTGKGTITQTGLYTAPTGVAVTDVVTACVGAAPCASANVTVTNNFDGPAELPRVLIDSSMANTPAPGKQTNVTQATSFQTALNNASCGDTLLLAAGATFNGKFTFPQKACDDQHWIIIRTSTPDAQLPPEGTRLLPCYAGVQSLPGRPVFANCPSTPGTVLTAKLNFSGIGGNGPIWWAAGANHYRIGPGIEVTRTAGTGVVGALTVSALNVNHIVWDRDWIHGVPQDETATGIELRNQQTVAIVDSYTSDFHCTSVIGACTDAHPIGGGLDTVQSGPFRITNTFLEGAGQGILFGGGSATFTPADIQIAGNHFFKPLTWMKGQPGFVGGVDTANKCNNGGQCPFIVKNHFELKNAQRVLFEGNIMENVWGGYSQVGFVILLTPKNQAGAACPACMVQDVTIRYSRLSHSGSGIALANATADNGALAAYGQRYSIHDITIDDVSATKYNGTGGMFQIWNAFPAPGVLNSISINHVTVFPDTRTIALANEVTAPMTGLWITNSIVGPNGGWIFNAGNTASCAYGKTTYLAMLSSCWPGGYTFASNALVGTTATKWPTGNMFPATTTVVDFVNFNGGNGGDYHLAPGSPYKSAGSDGKDLGADIDAINTATQNAN